MATRKEMTDVDHHPLRRVKPPSLACRTSGYRVGGIVAVVAAFFGALDALNYCALPR
jgi:hypothetical protein